MIATKQCTPKNSLVLISGSSAGEIPASMSGKLVVATPSCIAVGTLSEFDGETSITLTDEQQPMCIDNELHVVFTGHLETQNLEVSVRNVLDESILTMSTKSKLSEVQICANDNSEPNKLIIIVK